MESIDSLLTQPQCFATWARSGPFLVALLSLTTAAIAQPSSDDAEPILNLVRQGQRSAAAEQWDRLESSPVRNRIADQMAQAMTKGSSPGGGAIADFDTLINLITSTVEPDSWETNGGIGAMQGFPSGVHVDADGCLSRTRRSIAAELRTSIQDALHENAAEPTASKLPFRKVSLPRLERAWLRHVLAGEKIPDEMYRMAGLQRISYVAIHEPTGDIILAGPASDDGPALSLDAWLHVFHNAMQGERRFGCSIEPRAASMAEAQRFIQQSAQSAIPPGQRDRWSEQLRDRLGRQQIHVHGLDPRCHAARIIVAADYHMKLIGMGIESGEPFVQSYLSMVELGADGRPPALDVLRWWFTLDYDRIECNKDRTAFRLVGKGAKVLCENEFLAEQGRRIHTGMAEPRNQEFAHQFTRQLDRLATEFPIYRQLQGVFDLAIAAALIRDEGWAAQLDWEPVPMLRATTSTIAGAPTATDVESVVNVRVLNRQYFITGVSGGVEVVPADVTGQLVQGDYSLRDAAESLAPRRSYAEDARWWWD